MLRGLVGMLMLVSLLLGGCNPSTESTPSPDDSTTNSDASSASGSDSSAESASPMVIDLGSSFEARGIQGSSYFYSESHYRVDFERLSGVTGTGHIRHLVDLNNDGTPELLTLDGVADSESSTVTTKVYRVANEQAELYNPWNPSAPDLVWPRKSLVADFDSNGYLDAVLLGHGWDQEPFPGEPVQYFLNHGGTLTPYEISGSAQSPTIRAFWHGGSAADIDVDGHIDLVLSDADAIQIFLNDGDGNFGTPTALPDSAGFYTLELVDLNKDGHADILAGGHEFDDTPTAYVLGNGDGTFSDPVVLPSVPGWGVVVDLDVFDGNGDDLLEILVTRTGGTSASDPDFYEGHYIQRLTSIEGSYVSSTLAESASGDWIEWLHIQDIDEDGKLEAYSDLLNSGHEWDLN